MALVFDEYGHFEGIVTPGDILEAITGAFQEEEGDEKPFVTREDGSYLVSGWMQVDEFQDRIGVPIGKDAKFETVAGFVLAELNHLPQVGEVFERGHWRFGGDGPRWSPHRQGAGVAAELAAPLSERRRFGPPFVWAGPRFLGPCGLSPASCPTNRRACGCGRSPARSCR